jgi:hypothetical protein
MEASGGDVFLQRALVLKAIYHRGYEFPHWVVNPANFARLEFHRARVYYPSECYPVMVRRLLTEREPVNMGMERHFDQRLLEACFGWGTSYYLRHFAEHGVLAPNVAAYTYTPVVVDRTVRRAHVLNLVGYAFDHPEQPDYRHFFKTGELDVAGLLAAYLRMWRYAGICATDHGLRRVHVAKVGGGAFAPAGIDFDAEIHAPCMAALKAAFPALDVVEEYFPDFVVPSSLGDYEDFDDTLFVNAWDPSSLAGNGNASDKSLDGQWGRISAIAVLASPLTNGAIRGIPVPST